MYVSLYRIRDRPRRPTASRSLARAERGGGDVVRCRYLYYKREYVSIFNVSYKYVLVGKTIFNGVATNAAKSNTRCAVAVTPLYDVIRLVEDDRATLQTTWYTMMRGRRTARHEASLRRIFILCIRVYPARLI